MNEIGNGDISPKQIAALSAHAWKLTQSKNHAGAEHILLQLAALVPNDANIQSSLAFACYAQGKLAEAAERWQKSLALDTANDHIRQNLLTAWNRLGLDHSNRKEYAKAIYYLRRLAAARPGDAELHCNLGVMYKMMNRLPEALLHYRHSLDIAPDTPLTHWNYSRALLMNGNLTDGFHHYEARTHFQHLGPYPDWLFSLPRWNGEIFAGKRLVVYSEQGLGDILHFIRYLPLAKERGGTTIFSSHPALLRLFRGMSGIDEIIPHTEEANRHIQADYGALLLSLPHIFGTTLDTIPAAVPYLRPDPALARQWHQRLDSAPRKIGLVWAGNTREIADRSCGLQVYAPLAGLPRTTFYSLQKGQAAAEAKNPPPGLHLIDLTEDIADFADTAALVANLDMVITIDTSVAHLAGAMGKPVWTLLPLSTCWRWLLNRTDTPWYPTMRLYRQPSFGDWAGVIDQIRRDLS